MLLADWLERLGPGFVAALVVVLGWWAYRTQRAADDADRRDPNVLEFQKRIKRRYESERPPAA